MNWKGVSLIIATEILETSHFITLHFEDKLIKKTVNNIISVKLFILVYILRSNPHKFFHLYFFLFLYTSFCLSESVNDSYNNI